MNLLILQQVMLEMRILVFAVLFLLFGCDPEGRKKCDWVLEPEASLMGKTEPGFVPVCARNRKTQKQDCRLQATLDIAKAAQGKKFRYVDIVVESPALPRTVKSIKRYCD